MAFTNILFGIASGIGIQTFTNSLMRQRLLYRKFVSFIYYFTNSINFAVLLGPWMHVIVGAAGAYIGYKYDEWDDAISDRINDYRLKRGLKPLTHEELKAGKFS